jgi:hypothetical protein
MQKNESTWTKPPIIINSNEVPLDIKRSQVDQNTLPEGYTLDDVVVLPNTYD